jgi:uncharacterized membrane protein YphA (DoxX/SURF4 family)
MTARILSKTQSRVVWALQVVLAILFLFGGITKLLMPAATLATLTPLPVWFLRFISVAEITGGLGLLLPRALRIRPELTPIAAACLLIIMAGAVVVSFMTPKPAGAVFPFVVGVLLAYVAWRLWPIGGQTGVAALDSRSLEAK